MRAKLGATLCPGCVSVATRLIESNLSELQRPRISREDLARMRTHRILPNFIKIPLFVGAMVLLTWLVWVTESELLRWSAYVALGYLWMSMVTFMHDATHNAMFESRTANLAFGIVSMMPIFVTFITFKEDHLEHHRFNRSPLDPDAFTMGKRGFGDFVLFYAYPLIGGLLSFIHFNFIYPVKKFGAALWGIHLFEIALKAAVCWVVLSAAAEQGVLVKTLEVWLWPVFFFSLLNSMRFIAEHYGTPWNAGQLAGTRTIISNPVHSFFWNNINWHIGHHVYPNVPWYNLVELHRLLEPQIEAAGAVVDRSYLKVYLDAIRNGPEREDHLAEALRHRQDAAA
ncbi:MAG: fatty acid desaturase [Gammaproteobacteria bacterium]|nr:fatty acid desaturase [Gammaproteobacteria bacterium]